jgi:hypothetical protein
MKRIDQNPYAGPTIDQWSYYDYKPTFGGLDVQPGFGIAPMWVHPMHRRRLQAYKLLESFYRNCSRDWLDSTTIDQKDIDSRREYGDPEVIAEAALSSLIGSDQSIVVPDSDSQDADQASLDELSVLLAWSEDERFIQKVVELERTTTRIGDGVFVLGWDERKGRPRLNVYDPGFYFPVLDEVDMGDDDFPRTVHIAYEYERIVDGKTFRYLRKMTWQLGLIEAHDATGQPVNIDDQEARLYDSETLDEFGQIQRLYPWNIDPTDQTCYYTDATWELGRDELILDDLRLSEATITANAIDLGIDFLPVVHVPNTVSWTEHFGVPVIARTMQLLDDLVATDTDMQSCSAILGTPPISVSGASLPKNADGKVTTYGPGTVWETGDGTATLIDTSQCLDALLKYADHLLERLAINSRTPESLLGRVKPSEVPSGITLALSFTPHSNMIREMRLVRKDKYRLLLKFVVRYFMMSGDLLEYYPAELRFGSFLPADRQETSVIVQQLYTIKAISLETAVAMMVEAGFPIESAYEEVQLIRHDDFASANAMLDATGDVIAVRERLGIGPPPPLDVTGLQDALGTLAPPPPAPAPAPNGGAPPAPAPV